MPRDVGSSPQNVVCENCLRNDDCCDFLQCRYSLRWRSEEARQGQRAVAEARMAVLNNVWQSGSARSGRPTRLEIQPQELDHLMRQYLDIFHESVPIFPKERFLAVIGDSPDGIDLVRTMALITAKITGFKFASADFDLDARINLVLSAGLVEQEAHKAPPTINQFRKDCLLTFYESQQFLGNQAWVRLGGLVRLAYRKGLDRLDEAQTGQTRVGAWGGASQDDLDDWRLVWWFIYRLDTSVSLSLGTPYLIDEKNVKTSLPGPDLLPEPVLPGFTNEERRRREGTLESRLYLPCHPNDHWQLIPDITFGSPATIVPNLDILFSTAIRQFGRAFRLRMATEPEAGTPPTRSLNDADTFLLALQHGLHRRYFDPTRRTSPEESPSDHRQRLTTLVHFHMCKLLLHLTGCSSVDQGKVDWVRNWREVLETCRGIAAAAWHLNSAYSQAVDPRIAPIIFTALVFVHLHLRFHLLIPDSDLHHTLQQCETILDHLLKQLATTWEVPGLLLGLFESFKSLKCLERGTLGRRRIQSAVLQFESPLNANWLEFIWPPEQEPESQVEVELAVEV